MKTVHPHSVCSVFSFSRLAVLLTVGIVSLLASGCERATGESSHGEQQRPLVVSTTTMLEDLVREIGGDVVVSKGIMQPGGDPHLYQPSPGDAMLVAKSQMVVTNGLYLEGWIDDLVENAGGERPTVVAADAIEPLQSQGDKRLDPHFWLDIQRWQAVTNHVAQSLERIVPKKDAEEIRERADAYVARLKNLESWTRTQIATIPKEHRVLVTSHDAFHYFGTAYGLKVVGIQGISTEEEASQRDVLNVVRLIHETQAPAVFVETSVNPALIRQVARETGIRAAGPLYGDSLGASKSPAGTYVGMMRENVSTIVEALGGAKRLASR